MQGMFEEATVFNQNISGWNVSSVTESDDFKALAPAFDDDNAPHFP
jgi:surface protein